MYTPRPPNGVNTPFKHNTTQRFFPTQQNQNFHTFGQNKYNNYKPEPMDTSSSAPSKNATKNYFTRNSRPQNKWTAEEIHYQEIEKQCEEGRVDRRPNTRQESFNEECAWQNQPNEEQEENFPIDLNLRYPR